jgi:uncharacterized membrane protein
MEKTVKSNKERIRDFTTLAIFIAIIAVLGLVPGVWQGYPLGFIFITPDMAATIIHIPVLIGGALLGRKAGIWLGTAFGIVSLIAAFIYQSPLFYYPWVSVLPRILFGFLIYDVLRIFLKIIKNRYLAYGIGFFVLTIIHTLLVLPMLWTSYAIYFDVPFGTSLAPYLVFLVAVFIPITAPIEAVAAGLVGTIVPRLKDYLANRSEETAED